MRREIRRSGFGRLKAKPKESRLGLRTISYYYCAPYSVPPGIPVSSAAGTSSVCGACVCTEYYSGNSRGSPSQLISISSHCLTLYTMTIEIMRPWDWDWDWVQGASQNNGAKSNARTVGTQIKKSRKNSENHLMSFDFRFFLCPNCG